MSFLKSLACCLMVALLPIHTTRADESPLDASKGPNGETVIYLVGVIDGASAARVITQVKNAPPGPIRLVIMSPGGEVGAGYLLMTFLGERGGITCDARAAFSMAAILFESPVCETRVVHPETVLMFHSPATSGAEGTAEDLRAQAISLDSFSEAIADLIAPRMGLTREQYLDLVRGKGQVWATGSQAIKRGWADKMYAPPSKDAPVDHSQPPAF